MEFLLNMVAILKTDSCLMNSLDIVINMSISLFKVMKTDENLLNAIRAFRKCSTFSSVRAYIFKQKQAKKMEEKIEK